MKPNWFVRMLAALDETIDLVLLASIVFLLALFCCTLTQTHGTEFLTNILMPIRHG